MAQISSAADRPNIIIIMVDDMGFSDIGCYGSEIDTPHLDQMAAGGVRFTQAYNCARCCPTRASILTGLYPHQAGVGYMVGDYRLPGYRGFLNNECVTIAEVLRSAGYSTWMSGKWHVGGAYAPDKPETWRAGDIEHPTPRQRGFDNFYGTLTGAGSYFNPPTLMQGDSLIEPDGDDYHYTDATGRHAVRMIEQAAQDDKPFFLYAAFTAPHWPLHAWPEDIAKFDGRYNVGWDTIRQRRHEELKGLGILSKKWDISLRDDQAPAWDDISNRSFQAMLMEVYAAQVYAMDRSVGEILSALKKSGIEDNTLVMFLSDNGGCAEFLAEDDNKPDKHRYGLPTRDGRPTQVGNLPHLSPGPDDTFMSYGLPWANASNSPFRLYKHWVHEGGISTPLIVQWPRRIQQSLLVDSPVHVIDIMPTCLEAAKASYPDEFDGKPITPVAGESFVPAIDGRNWLRENPIFWEHEGNCAVRVGALKLVNRQHEPWELYDLENDRTELKDISDGNMRKVSELVKMYDSWADRSYVIERDKLIKLREITMRSGTL
jgi:arylsulfatase A-like enzyme